jgi:phytoene/squalene synthetase
MTVAIEIEPTKTEHGENFPVASRLIAPRLRGDVLAFYRFARAADDIADHATLAERQKFAGLDALEDTLIGKRDSAAAALPLRSVLAERNLPPPIRSIFFPPFAPTSPSGVMPIGTS